MENQKSIALNIVKHLRKARFEAVWAGGCVRDLVMKKKPHDIDIATSAHPEQVEKLFRKTIPIGKQFGVILVQESQHTFEVATFRAEGKYLDGRHPEEVHFTDSKKDALRRDFTVNALFYDPVKKRVIDYVQGRKDIRAKIIRTVGDPYQRFDEDKLRILRAVRFAANLGFTIEPKTWKAVKQIATQINQVSQERIREELVKIFTRPNAGRGLLLLDESGLLQEIMPEISAMKGVEQGKQFHPEGDVFIHTKLLLDKLKNPSVILAFGALLHDVGKPPTFHREGDKIHFYEHAEIGAEMARQLMKRLRFSNKEIDDVVGCVANHMKFANVTQMREGKLKRFIGSSTFPVEMELHRIDCLSCHGNLENYHFLKKKIKAIKKENLKPKPLINGLDLISEGYKPGPIMGTILHEAYDCQLEGVFSSKQEAINWVNSHYKKNRNVTK